MRLYLVAIGVIFAMLVAYILVERLYRRFAARHPELGPFRSDDGKCGACAAAASCGKPSCKS